MKIPCQRARDLFALEKGCEDPNISEKAGLEINGKNYINKHRKESEDERERESVCVE